jgi:hypothetical protein
MDIDSYSNRRDKKRSKKSLSFSQERRIANMTGGNTTIASGALPFDKADVRVGDTRIECKRTDKNSIILKKDYLLKLKNQCKINETPVVNIEIQDENWYLVTEEDFLFINDRKKVLDKK